ncbi:SusC/RagA family TonB-linked outer membrane protein [Galbibacter sp. EGI 63066]|uniref:SusC/RagA family TonB-linked outer membrane protein n=1 Tax=Galbibacter sp. EGI 63066 TaxID=2993559 RepID=UPI0022499FDF|nr:SusC/RagA family TonB-linked outer membrane protein [Galbibacter sp. EGI 63066]MCX2679822.1 SusC/RagA family TonB-linked outer membrane protein [Galbibacter sp. EGI 63066]
MFKILQLTGLFCILLIGSAGSNLYAQNVSDSTSINSQSNKGIEVKGLIKSAKTSEGISGINISVKDFSAAISEDDGNFSINVPHLNVLLTVSGEGYQTKVFPLNNRESGIEICLFEENYSQFYQTATLPGKEQLQYTTPNAVKVTNLEEDQWGNPVNQSIAPFLQGRMAGLNSVRNSGVPGAGAYLTIRGFNSLYATNKPLIVVDGMVYDEEDYGSGILQYNSSSPLSMIDVKDIEDITVLKDGSSLYGTKGGNGVIIITTTRPVELSTKIDFTMYGGINEDPQQLPLLNAAQHRIYLSQLLATRGDSQEQIANMPWMNDSRLGESFYQYHNNTDWQDQVFKSSTNQNYYLKVRGGDDIAKFGLSVGYLNSEGVIGDSGLKRYNTRLNAALRLSEKLLVNTNLSFIYNEENQYNQGLAYKTSPMYLALTKSPFTHTNAINSSGQVSPNLSDVDIFNIGNPIAIIENGIGINKNYRFSGNLNFKYSFSDSFTANLIGGLTYNKERERFFIPDFGIADITLPTAIANNRSGSETQRYYSLFTDAYLNYSKSSLDYKHNFDVRLGLRTQTNESESDLGLGFNSATDDFTTVGSGSNLLRIVGGAIGEWKWINGYLSAEYNYLNKYYLTLNSAYDGSSRFGEKIGFSGLGSLSGAWLLSSEDFMKDASNIDLFKLRASIGVSGNDDIGNYTAQQLYVSQNLLGLQGLVRDNIGNPELKWEDVIKYNLGIDIALFNERLNATFDVYQNKTTDMITYASTNSISGFDYVVSNSGSMITHGYDFGVNGRLLNTADISFDLGVNIARYKNEIRSIPDDRILTEFGGATYITQEGQDANLFYGHQAKGVYSTTAEADAAGLLRRMENGSLMPFGGGDIIFEDLNGDKIIDENDRKVIGNPNPDFTGSFSAKFSYKRLSISGLFNFSVGNDLYNGVRRNLEQMSGYENQSYAVKNRWVAEGQQTSIPKATWGDPLGNASFSSRWIEDGSYLRLKTLVVSYDVDVDLNHIKYMKLYASGNNLFTLTDYLGYDPEFSATSSIFGQGADLGLMPQFMTIQLGLRLGL